MKRLLTSEIPDKYLRENTKDTQAFLDGEAILRFKWKFFEITIDKAVTEHKIPHGLTFVPQDLIQLRLTGAGQVTWLYDKFTKENLYVTTTDACKIRFMVGLYSEDPRK